jgi:ABC-type protease/lipase transport system fused ATPase/permease subunit
LLLSGAITVLTLATPVFVMLTYDRVAGTGSTATLLYLGLGGAQALEVEPQQDVVGQCQTADGRLRR